MAPVNAIWMASKTQLRRRWPATVALVVLVGLAGSAVLAAVAGASRTDTAMRRLVAYSRPEDVYVTINAAGDPAQPGVVEKMLADRARLVALPEVAEAARAPYLLLSPDKSGNELGGINAFAAADDRAFRTMDRPLLLEGRSARPDRPNEAVVSDGVARLRNLRVGSRVTLWSYSAEQNNIAFAGGFGKIPAPEGPAYTFDVVGIARQAADVNAPPPSVVGDALFLGQGAIVLTPAFLARFAGDQGVPLEALPGIEGFRIRLRRGLADLAAFRQSVVGLARPEDVRVGSDVRFAADKAQRAMRLEAIALLLFAAVAAMAALVIVGQPLARLVAADTTENPTLGALGMERSQLVLVPLVRAGLVALGGGAAAVAVAIVVSPLTPIGLARRAEPHPGVDVNVAVLGFGFLGVVGLTMLRALLSAWRAAADRRAVEAAPVRPGLLAAAVARSRLGPTAATGVAMSFERGRGIGFRTGLLAAAAAVTGVVAAITFGVSLRHLVATPREQGWNWDVVVGNPNTQAYAGDPAADPLYQKMVGLLAANRSVGEFSGVALTDVVTVDNRLVNIVGLEALEGSVFPAIVEGRAPVSDDEIVLGRDPLRQIHGKVGHSVTARTGDRSVTMRVVGVSLLPTAGDLSPRLSEGGFATVAGLRQLVPGIPVLQFAIRYRPGVDPEAARRSLRDDFGRVVLRPFPGGEVGNLAKVDFLPPLLAGVLVVLAVGALGLTLLAWVRRHRRDLAVLETIGFVRLQLVATVAWQATTLAVGALLIGVPVGITLGRWTWRLVADGLGSVSPPIVPLGAVLLVIPITLLVANLLAIAPGWLAARAHPADTLRAE